MLLYKYLYPSLSCISTNRGQSEAREQDTERLHLHSGYYMTGTVASTLQTTRLVLTATCLADERAELQ
jgi:hypothetical protein